LYGVHCPPPLLQALLPWVTGSFNEEETQAMMGSLREATKNTMFDQWLDAVQSGGLASSSSAGVGPAALLSGTGAAGNQLQQQQQHQMEELAEIAEYLTAGLAPAAVDAGGASLAAAEEGRAQPQQQQPQQQQTEVSGTVAESTNYVPGWEDIFNINQKQLEAAIRRVSNDPTLEPQRKAYLIQNIMVSRYIVAQQRRMQVSAAAVNVGGSTGGQAGQGRAAAATASAELPQLAVLPAGSGGVAAGCSHGHERRQDVCGGQPLQQQQQQQVHAGPPVFDSHKAVQQPLPAGAAAVGGVTRLVGHQGHHGTYADAAAGVLGCQHYRRSARLVSPCCGKVFTCRWAPPQAQERGAPLGVQCRAESATAFLQTARLSSGQAHDQLPIAVLLPWWWWWWCPARDPCRSTTHFLSEPTSPTSLWMVVL
jgi:zinc finger-like protein